MGTIGLTTDPGSTYSPSTTSKQKLFTGTGYPYTPAAAEEVYQINIYTGTGTGQQIDFGIFDITSGVTNAPIVVAGIPRITTTTTSSNEAFTIASPIPLSSGRTYVLGWRYFNGVASSIKRAAETGTVTAHSTLDGTSALTTLWTGGTGTDGFKYGIYATTRATTDTAPPTFTAGPGKNSVAATTVTITGTSNETGTAAVVGTAIGASQPADATFDAVTFAITAATPFTSNVTGATQASLVKYWVQIKDAAGNRTTSSVAVLHSHTGYVQTVAGTPNADPAIRLTASPADFVAGDIVDVPTGVTVNSDLTYDFASAPFTYYGGNLTDGWGASAQVALGSSVSGTTKSLTRSLTLALERSLTG